MLAVKADTEAYTNQLRKARESSLQAIDSAERAKEDQVAATYVVVAGLRQALFGNAEAARHRAASAIQHAAARDVQYGAALTLAYARDDARAKTLGDDLAKRFPEDTLVLFNYLPTLHAKLAVNQGRASEAIELLRSALPYELGYSASTTYYWNALFPVFVQGEALLAAHQGSEAVAEFQKVLHDSGIVFNEPIGGMSHLQLAHAYTMQGDTTKAKAAYQDFLNLWKDADPDVPVLKEAKAEYAKLQ